MTLFFQSADGTLRKLSELDLSGPRDEITRSVFSCILDFCNKHRYKIPYTRCWNDELDGRPVTFIDVGSHTEFFILDPVCPYLIN